MDGRIKMQINVSWSDLKAFISSRSLSIQWITAKDTYFLWAIDGPMELSAQIQISDPIEGGSDQEDFENNYKNNGNKKLSEPRDSDGSPLNRVKITTTGWAYQLHGVEFKTSQLDSVHEEKVDGTNYGFTTIHCYKDNGNGGYTACTDQSDVDANCIKTVVDWEPTHDYEIVGGMFKQKEIPDDDIRVWVVGVPDVPEQYGGSKSFAASLNLKYFGIDEGIKVDGRAPKYMTYSAIYHSNKIRMILKHSPGTKHDVHMTFEIFKA